MKGCCNGLAEQPIVTIDWNAFTPYASLAGGMLIGLAAAQLLGMGLFEWLERRTKRAG